MSGFFAVGGMFKTTSRAINVSIGIRNALVCKLVSTIMNRKLTNIQNQSACIHHHNIYHIFQ